MMSRQEELSPELSLAIVGMAGRFPGAPDIARFWQNVMAGEKSIRSFPDQELLAAGVAPELLYHPDYVKAGAVLEDVAAFDGPFFGFSPREAEIIDPQSRLFLQSAWEALESAGYDPAEYEGLIGIFAGKSPSSYLRHNLLSNPDVMAQAGRLQLSSGNDADALASLVAYKLNLKGPAVAVQTFCSTSLVAVHLACQSLLAYECDMALAGGTAIEFPQGTGYLYQEGGILSPDGQCRPFDAAASGSVMGNGLGIVVLKRLADAQADGDYIYAVIRGSALNNDGVNRASYAAPGLNGQAAVIFEALGNAGVGAETISYVETHGTGTPLGDAIELAAMIKVFSKATDQSHFCAIGSVKPNVGHLDRASGVTGLIKTALALNHRLLPPSLNFATPNPDFDWDDNPFYVNTELTTWESNGPWPRRAGVSSFGLGGTNVHLVLEEAPPPPPSAAARPYQLLLLSAKSEAALEQATANLAGYLNDQPDGCVADVAYTLQTGRAAFSHRRMVVCRDAAEGAALLTAAESEQLFTNHEAYQEQPVIFLFPDAPEFDFSAGQELYAVEPIFRDGVDEVCRLLAPLLGADLRPYFAARPENTPAQLARPTLFVLQYALSRLLQAWGIRPLSAWGSGVGAWAAAYLSGESSLEEACLAVAGHRLPGRNGSEGVMIAPGSLGEPMMQSLQSEHSQAIFLEVGPGQALRRQLLNDASYQSGSRPFVLTTLPEQGTAMSPSAFLLQTVGQFWLAGGKIEWSGFYRHEQRRRIPLPTYPFARRRYWIEENSKPPEKSRSGGKKKDIGDWFYLPAWKQSPLWPSTDVEAKPTSDVEAKPTSEGVWLLFVDQGAFDDLVAERLARRGATIFRVRSGAAFTRHDENHYSVNPAEPADYRRLLKTLPAMPTKVAHFWGLDSAEASLPSQEKFARAQQLGFYSLMFFVQAIEHYTAALSVWVVTGNGQAVSGSETIYPEKAPVIGACRVISQENRDIVCRTIDVERPQLDWQAVRLAEQLMAEFAHEPAELAVAYRGHARWVQLFEPCPVPPVAAPPLRQGGVYLITGGLGQIGMVIARYLATAVQAKVVLTTRSDFPLPEQWPEWVVTHEPDEAITQKIHQLQAIEALGAQLLVLPADVADEQQMRRALAEIERQLGTINGVFHAAGVSGVSFFAPMQQLAIDQCEAHFRAKGYGLYVLERSLEGRDLDFCLLFSSLSSVLGGLAFGAYTAANLFVDAFTHCHNRRHRQWWRSVNWDTWQTRPGQHNGLGATVAEFEMVPDEAIRALERVIGNGPVTQLVNSTGDLEARLDQWVRPGQRVPSPDHSANGTGQRTLHPRPELMGPYVAPSDETERIIATIWQEVLGIEGVGIEDNFLELGGHSLMAMEIHSRLRQTFQVHLPLTVLFEAPTIAQTAVAIELAIIEEMEGLVEE